MTLLIAASARRQAAPAFPPNPDYPWTSEPVTHPTSRPYNAATYAITPTPDGTGSVVHPDVIDFATLLGHDWNGWRYWMAMTPYFNTNDDLENPCILVSNDGQTWQVPVGLTNPVYPMPTAPQYNSDTDLVYDPDTDELVLIYRGGDLLPKVARSSDGTTWPAEPSPVSISFTGEMVSPAVVRRGSGDWIMFGAYDSPRRVAVWESSDLLTWAGPTNVTGITGMVAPPWHLDVIQHLGRFYMLVDTYIPSELYAATSDDGFAWTLNPTPVLSRLLPWDQSWMYRATLQPHEDGERFRVWYSAQGVASWRVGYTHIPLTEWPTT